MKKFHKILLKKKCSFGIEINSKFISGIKQKAQHQTHVCLRICFIREVTHISETGIDFFNTWLWVPLACLMGKTKIGTLPYILSKMISRLIKNSNEKE